MEKRTDDRDRKKSMDEATDDPRQANRDDQSQQAAELQVGESDERREPERFEPDSNPRERGPAVPPEKKETIDEP